MHVVGQKLFAPDGSGVGEDYEDALLELLAVLHAAKRLLARPENRFGWSGWENAEDAQRALDSLIQRLSRNDWPDAREVSILFAPTGPIQEVSISGGWSDAYMALAERFDSIERRIWPAGDAGR